MAATGRAPGGPLRLIGACIPRSHAHVSTGSRDRAPWQDHLIYLKHLGQLLAARDDAVPTLLVGDFNQRITRTRAPIRVATALRETLGDLVAASAGDVPGLDRTEIDHVAHSASLAVRDLEDFDRHDAHGRPLSDHDSVSFAVEP